MDPIVQLFLQLGIGGAVIFVCYKLWDKALDRQAISEAARTKVIGDGFAAITGTLSAHATADAASHRDMSDKISEFRGQLAGVLDGMDRFTPPPFEVPQQPSQPIQRWDQPSIPRRETPARGVVSIPIVERSGRAKTRGDNER